MKYVDSLKININHMDHLQEKELTKEDKPENETQDQMEIEQEEKTEEKLAFYI